MRVVFAGTPVFAAAALQAIADAGHTIECVFTQPDRPAGRGMKLQASPVKQLAVQLGLPVLQPEKLRSGPQAEAALHTLQNPSGSGRPDVMVVAAYGLILPRSVLESPLHGCLNIHASLLPRWRGAAPIHRAIEAGDEQTGITIMQMDEGLDTGDICRMAALPIGRDNTGRLHDRLAVLGAAEIVAALDDLAAGRLQRTPQPHEGTTYAAKISRDEARIDWTASADVIRNRTAAFDPQPGAVTQMPGSAGDLKLFDAQVAPQSAGMPAAAHALPGQVLQLDAAGLWVACGSDAVCFASAQRPGGKRQASIHALQGSGLQVGDCLGAPAP